MHIVGLLFVSWVLMSNIQSAWFGSGRNWFLTFLQLWALVWLSGELMDSPEKQRVFMWIFSIVSAIAALIAIQQGNIGDTVSTSIRASGLAGNPNSTGRYLVVAMAFFSYLGATSDKRLSRLLTAAGIVITFVGVFFTLSRTSILLLIFAIGLQNILGARRKFSFSMILVYGIAALMMWFLSSQVMNILQSILPSILQGTDTIGVRYKLWQAAWGMWLDHPIQGVGIGMYTHYSRYYAPGLASHYWVSMPHNTYLSALAETGLVGFTLFSILLGLSFRNYIQQPKNNAVEIAMLQRVWLIVFIVVLLGEITANGLYDKLLWFLFGISIYFHNQFSARPQENTTSQSVRHDALPALRKY